MQKEKQLRHALEAWLHRNHLSGDHKFYSPVEWRARGEKYLNEADLVLTTEGGLCMLLNYTPDETLLEELDDLLESFGYYYELGYHWCLGFYPTEESVECSPDARYSEKLRDQRWQTKRDKVLNRAKGLCEDCKTPHISLEVHHCYYMALCQPWQYPLDSLRALCRPCHESRAIAENRLMALLARTTGLEINDIYMQLRDKYEERS